MKFEGLGEVWVEGRRSIVVTSMCVCFVLEVPPVDSKQCLTPTTL